MQNLEHIPNTLPDFLSDRKKILRRAVAIALQPEPRYSLTLHPTNNITLSTCFPKIRESLQNLQHISDMLPDFSLALKKFLRRAIVVAAPLSNLASNGGDDITWDCNPATYSATLSSNALDTLYLRFFWTLF